MSSAPTNHYWGWKKNVFANWVNDPIKEQSRLTYSCYLQWHTADIMNACIQLFHDANISNISVVANKKNAKEDKMAVKGICVCVTGFVLFQATLLTLRPRLSSQLKAQRRSTAGGRGPSVSSSICSTIPGFAGLSGSDTIITFILTLF